MKLLIDEKPLRLADVRAYLFTERSILELSSSLEKRLLQSEKNLHELLEKRIPVYGVTTGFGEQCLHLVDREKSAELQNNLISYLSCGTGPILPKSVSRAAVLFRLKSLSRGYSGVSPALIERLQLYLDRDWIPMIPREGSLGASGDLIPLAYIARSLRGEGHFHADTGREEVSAVLKRNGVQPYEFKPKEGLALVNGTSAMTAYALHCLTQAEFLTQIAALGSAWVCMAVKGRTEPFNELVNDKAKFHPGQSQIAAWVRGYLNQEDYRSTPIRSTVRGAKLSDEPVQSPYSLRCAPQILGPIVETIIQVEKWIETEINGTSDNPLFDDDGTLAMGGNFYGGYLSHGMDYLKISVAHLSDLLDRQLMLLFNDKTSNGLPPNLVDWQAIAEDKRFLHHGLKGLHQSVSAITSEVLAKSMPNGVFSRSAESHNQDKVSLGMSAASQCADMLEAHFTIQSMFLICAAQALDLRELTLKGEFSKKVYGWVRACVPRVSADVSLGEEIRALATHLKQMAFRPKD